MHALVKCRSDSTDHFTTKGCTGKNKIMVYIMRILDITFLCTPSGARTLSFAGQGGGLAKVVYNGICHPWKGDEAS